MGIVYRILASLAFALSLLSTSWAAEESSAVSGDVQLFHHVWKGSGTKPLTGASLYLEYGLSDTFAPYVIAYGDKYFGQGIVGLSAYLGDFQIALGVGSSRFDGANHLTVSPWCYYEDNGWEAFVLGEYYYLHGARVGYWGRGYLHKTVGIFVVGVAGERGVGIGPLVGFRPHKKVLFTVTAPVARQPIEQEDHRKLVANLKVMF